MKKKIGEILRAKGVVTEEQVQKALDYQRANQCKIGEALVRLGHCSQENVTRALATHFQLPFANLSKHTVPQELLDRVPKDVALEHKIVPVAQKGRKLIIAMSDPLDFFTLDNLRFILGTEVDCALATPEAVEEALDEYYRLAGGYDSVLGEEGEDDDDVEFGRSEYAGDDSEANDAPVIMLDAGRVGEGAAGRNSGFMIDLPHDLQSDDYAGDTASRGPRPMSPTTR